MFQFLYLRVHSAIEHLSCIPETGKQNGHDQERLMPLYVAEHDIKTCLETLDFMQG